MPEYIDREKLIAEYDRVHIGVAGGARKLMVDAPTEDVVPVVRCSQCKHWNNGDCYRIELTRPDDFCSYGERKNDNGNL